MRTVKNWLSKKVVRCLLTPPGGGSIIKGNLSLKGHDGQE